MEQTIVNNYSQSIRYQSEVSVKATRLIFSRIPAKQKVLPAVGITDVTQGVLVRPISAKYPNLGIFRWLDVNGSHIGEELEINFLDCVFLAPNTLVSGFEVYVRLGSLYTVKAIYGGSEVDLSNYYTKLETYNKTEIDNLVLNSTPTVYGFTYDQQVQPVGATNGDTWRERDFDENILGEWQRVGNRWLSLQPAIASSDGVITINADKNLLQTANFSYTQNGKVYLRKVVFNMINQWQSHDADNYYDFNFGMYKPETGVLNQMFYKDSKNLAQNTRQVLVEHFDWLEVDSAYFTLFVGTHNPTFTPKIDVSWSVNYLYPRV